MTSNSSIPFDRAVEYYDQTRGFPSDVVEPAIRMMAEVSDLHANSRVLEIGIGTGRIALPLAAHVHSIIGLDLSRPMMERLRAKQTTEAIHLIEGDATRLPLPDASVDAVVVVHVFHAVNPWEAALAEIRRVLKPNGVLISGDTDIPARQAYWALWFDLLRAPDAPATPFIPYRERIVNLGWERVKIDQYPHKIAYGPGKFYDNLKNRLYSPAWEHDDATFQKHLARFFAELTARYGDLSQPTEIDAAFVVDVLRPPQ